MENAIVKEIVSVAVKIQEKNNLSTSLLKAISRASKLLSPKSGFIHSVKRAPFYNDEPKLFSYLAILKDSSELSDGGSVDESAGGASLSPEKALMKALGEAIERYCLSIYREKNFVKASYAELRDKALNPSEVISFSPSQLKKRKFKNFVFNEHTRFKWIEGYSLKQGKEILVPAQIVYVPYKYKREKVIRFPITTGAASSSSLAEAIYRGICEVIEREAFIITYLNKLPRRKVDLQYSGVEIEELAEIYSRYNLELSIFDITTDIKIPVMLGLLIDRTRLGPAISLGASADLDLHNGAIKAAEEAQHSRPWMRKEMEEGDKNKSVCTLEGRGLYWSDVKMIPKIKFLEGKERPFKLKKRGKEKTAEENLKEALKALSELDLEVIFVEVTTREVKRAGFRVVRVIIPQLQPLYLDECFPYLGGKRLYNVPIRLGILKRRSKFLNRIPHPFL